MADPKPKRDLYAEVTAKLIAQIERNPGDPRMPWRRTAGAPLWMPANALTENYYRGINVLTLWATAEEKGYSSNIWATYKQYQELGAPQGVVQAERFAAMKAKYLKKAA